MLLSSGIKHFADSSGPRKSVMTRMLSDQQHEYPYCWVVVVHVRLTETNIPALTPRRLRNTYSTLNMSLLPIPNSANIL